MLARPHGPGCRAANRRTRVRPAVCAVGPVGGLRQVSAARCRERVHAAVCVARPSGRVPACGSARKTTAGAAVGETTERVPFDGRSQTAVQPRCGIASCLKRYFFADRRMMRRGRPRPEEGRDTAAKTAARKNPVSGSRPRRRTAGRTKAVSWLSEDGWKRDDFVSSSRRSVE